MCPAPFPAMREIATQTELTASDLTNFGWQWWTSGPATASDAGADVEAEDVSAASGSGLQTLAAVWSRASHQQRPVSAAKSISGGSDDGEGQNCSAASGRDDEYSPSREGDFGGRRRSLLFR